MIPKSARCLQLVVKNHPKKQPVFAYKQIVPGKASYANPVTTGTKQTKKDKTITFRDTIPKGIRHKEFD